MFWEADFCKLFIEYIFDCIILYLHYTLKDNFYWVNKFEIMYRTMGYLNGISI